MKYNLFYKKSLFIYFYIILIFLITTISEASIESDLKNITSKLRCMTCQNQTIYSSDTEFSLSIKKIIRQKLKNNESEKEIMDFLINRYGEYIVLKPKFNKQNFFLWLFPFIILALSLVFFILRIRKNT
jgi:cytochrome c-type biogenesis protein CcmH